MQYTDLRSVVRAVLEMCDGYDWARNHLAPPDGLIDALAALRVVYDDTNEPERPDYWDGYHQAMLGHPEKSDGGAEYQRGRQDGLAAFARCMKAK